jgi:uncharacterized protein (TIGR03435 family)
MLQSLLEERFKLKIHRATSPLAELRAAHKLDIRIARVAGIRWASTV